MIHVMGALTEESSALLRGVPWQDCRAPLQAGTEVIVHAECEAVGRGVVCLRCGELAGEEGEA